MNAPLARFVVKLFQVQSEPMRCSSNQPVTPPDYCAITIDENQLHRGLKLDDLGGAASWEVKELDARGSTRSSVPDLAEQG